MHSLQEVATALGISVSAASGLSELVYGEQRDLFSTNDLLALRAAQTQLKRRLPARKQLSEQPGQAQLDFGRTAKVAYLRPVGAREAGPLYHQAVSLEERGADASDVMAAYTDCVAADPYHADGHVNLGRLLHQRGRLAEAEAHYVAALVARPDDATATFNLAVVLEDMGRFDGAVTRYQECLQLDPRCVDAYFNLARIYEKKGEKMLALRHLKDYRRLSQGS